MDGINPKDVLVRAAKTFVQTFLSVAAVSQVVNGDIAGLKAAGIAALAAAISVVWNAALQWSSS